ncbi:AMP-binding protein [Virgibacillus dokdonensis]|uniref:AMP-binding protein n=1 Tax=Virgibacillus dokdonensis TaxID=302167 RepID=A0A2K9J3M0_9BACI|nr:AMP-binding protein [Virgibacillus dokdonensis]AUJ23590.1 putative acyl--CoA ligase YhfT [Virgibacillus dokdonensis]
MHLIEAIIGHAKCLPNEIALYDGEREITYCKLVQRMKKVAGALQNRGYHSGDKIGIISKNRFAFVEIFLGAVYAGCIPVVLDPKWGKQQTLLVIEKYQPIVIFEFDALFNVVSSSNTYPKVFSFSNNSLINYEDWVEKHSETVEMKKGNELLFIGFTSGTTGIPKGYLRSHKSWINSFLTTLKSFQLNNMKHVIAPGSFAQSLSLFSLLQSLYFGGTFHIMKAFSMKDFQRHCHFGSELVLFVVPTMVNAMLHNKEYDKANIQAIIVSGDKLSEEMKRQLKQSFPYTKIYEFYGSSEASYISYLNIYEEDRPNSVGRPFPGVVVTIRDEHFEKVSVGRTGQLCVRSELMFTGYYQSETTSAIFREGWLVTGDNAYMDEEGYLYIVGRQKNRIISGGMNIYPEQVETVLKKIANIDEVMVTGVADKYWGERVVAIIKWQNQRLLLDETIKKHCLNHLPSYMVPKQYIAVDKFIYTSSGKIARQKMNEMMKGEIV